MSYPFDKTQAFIVGYTVMLVDIEEIAAPALWNRLPADIRNAPSLENFKSLRKTHLYKIVFTDK